MAKGQIEINSWKISERRSFSPANLHRAARASGEFDGLGFDPHIPFRHPQDLPSPTTSGRLEKLHLSRSHEMLSIHQWGDQMSPE